MATPVDTYLDLTAALPHGLENQNVAFTEKFTIDADTLTVASGAILRLMNIPDKTLIEQIIVNVLTAEGGTLTLDIGDYTISDDVAVDADGYFDGVDGDTLGILSTNDEALVDGTPNTIRGYSHGGKYYDDALRYLGVLFNNEADAAIIEVIVIGKNLANVDA